MEREPQLSLVRTFGCTAYVHIHAAARLDKLDPRARKYMFVGISTSRHGWRLLDPLTHQIVESRDVVFWENKFPAIATIEAAKAFRKELREHPATYVPMLHLNAPLPSIESLLRSVNYDGHVSDAFASFLRVDTHRCPATAEDAMDRAENPILLHNFHDFPSSLVKLQPFMSFDDAGLPVTSFQRRHFGVTFSFHAEMVRYSCTVPVCHLFKDP